MPRGEFSLQFTVGYAPKSANKKPEFVVLPEFVALTEVYHLCTLKGLQGLPGPPWCGGWVCRAVVAKGGPAHHPGSPERGHLQWSSWCSRW
jgi:hypothetical protein